jgi:tetratricopeptide (TPR) repeat protein
MKPSTALVGVTAALAVASVAFAHEHDGETPTAAELGAVALETSCKEQAKADLNRGVALLHSFWHNEAGRAFAKAAASDRECAMAYWGQAMASFHLYSSTPSAADLKAVAQALKKGEAARERTPREAAYIRAARALVTDFKPTEQYLSAQRFADAMRDITAQYPRDVEAAAFYALGLLASDPPGDLDLVNARKAVAILKPLFAEHADHPGIVHYIIHASDNPHMAKEGLEAARRYAAIAPAAPHALHMPSHIFARRGLWEEDIASNLASKAASENTKGLHVGAENRLHAMEFLQYAYLQTGQYEEAKAIADEARTIKSGETPYADYYSTVEARFGALLAIETRDWVMAANLQPVPGAHWYSEAQTLLARVMAAGHARDAEASKAVLERFGQITAKVPVWPVASSSANLRDEIQAWAAFAQGDSPRAIELLRPVADAQARAGKGEVELPAREMLAEMLLLEGKASAALAEYEQSLRSDPNRFNGLLGAAKAADAAGRHDLATQYSQQLAANTKHASGAARALVSSHQSAQVVKPVEQLQAGEATTSNGMTTTLHQKDAGVRDASGWYAARSTEGHFTMRFPAPFNDATFVTQAEDGATIKVHLLVSATSRGLKLSANCFERSDAKFPPDAVSSTVKRLQEASLELRSQDFTRGELSGLEYRGIWANGAHFAGRTFLARGPLCQLMAEFPERPLDSTPDDVRKSFDSFEPGSLQPGK